MALQPSGSCTNLWQLKVGELAQMAYDAGLQVVSPRGRALQRPDYIAALFLYHMGVAEPRRIELSEYVTELVSQTKGAMLQIAMDLGIAARGDKGGLCGQIIRFLKENPDLVPGVDGRIAVDPLRIRPPVEPPLVEPPVVGLEQRAPAARLPPPNRPAAASRDIEALLRAAGLAIRPIVDQRVAPPPRADDDRAAAAAQDEPRRPAPRPQREAPRIRRLAASPVTERMLEQIVDLSKLALAKMLDRFDLGGGDAAGLRR